MIYCVKENRLKAIRDENLQGCTLLASNKISQMLEIINHSNAAFLLHKKNRWSLFGFAWFQLKAKTTKEFKTIIYVAPKDFLFYVLKVASFLSFGQYRLIEWGKNPCM